MLGAIIFYILFRRATMNGFEIALIIIISIMAIFLIFILPYISYSMAFKRGKDSGNPKEGLDKPFFKQYKDVLSEKIDRLSAIDCKILTITASDGTKLSARYYHTRDGAPLQIQCHGYRGNPLREFSGGGLVALEGNFNVLMIYQRAHGLSEGRAITFGEKERLDALDWINYSIKELNATKIVLMGISMGAATVLMASELELPKEVKCIAADCPYSTTEGIIKRVVGGRKLSPNIMYPFIKLGAIMYGGFTPDRHSPASAVKNSRVPILLIHGEADDFVPTYMSHKIYESSPEVIEFHTFPGAGHGASYMSNPDRYTEILTNFVNKHLQ